MKLLRVIASGFKNCCDHFTIDFVARSKKTSEDKEYELKEIDEGLFTFNTMAIVGKNASGKTSAIDLLDCCYSILGNFRLESKKYSMDNVSLEIYFYHESWIYRYTTILKSESALDGKTCFTEQHLYKKKYYKTRVKELTSADDFKEMKISGELPEDTSIVFFVLKKKTRRAVYFDCNGKGEQTYRILFEAMKTYNISYSVLLKIIRLFDTSIRSLEMIDKKMFRLVYNEKTYELSDTELLWLLSSGTTKGILLYVYVIAALQNGFDLLIDEVENHFHKTLVDNMISLFKDKSVNKKQATLVFTTHYCEVLDLFNRQDNIWIAKSLDKITLQNMYSVYNVRTELLKSRQFYNNTFDTAVNYEDLMAVKKELMD